MCRVIVENPTTEYQDLYKGALNLDISNMTSSTNSASDAKDNTKEVPLVHYGIGDGMVKQ